MEGENPASFGAAAPTECDATALSMLPNAAAANAAGDAADEIRRGGFHGPLGTGAKQK